MTFSAIYEFSDLTLPTTITSYHVVSEYAGNDKKLQVTSDMEPDAAWRWWTLDPQMDEICAIVVLDYYGHELRSLYHPLDALEGKPVPVILDGTVTYTLPVAFNAAEPPNGYVRSHL